MSEQRRYSFEFFPTKTDAGHEKLLGVARELAAYRPDFFSCTTAPAAQPATAH